jgi:hypothetical protein
MKRRSRGRGRERRGRRRRRAVAASPSRCWPEERPITDFHITRLTRRSIRLRRRPLRASIARTITTAGRTVTTQKPTGRIMSRPLVDRQRQHERCPRRSEQSEHSERKDVAAARNRYRSGVCNVIPLVPHEPRACGLRSHPCRGGDRILHLHGTLALSDRLVIATGFATGPAITR